MSSAPLSPPPSPLQRHLPNALTVARLVLAGAFFASLNVWRYDHANPLPFWGNVGLTLFILAAVTDALDGYLARRWQVVSVFGRIMDPVCDKVLVLGAFVYLAGPRFVMPEKVAGGELFAMSSGVYPWMAVVVIFRELLVTGVRSVAEAMGVDFSSNWWGKAKMILQTIAIPVAICVAVNFDPALKQNTWAVWLRDILVWGTVFVTIGSGVPYVLDFWRVMKSRGQGAGKSGAGG